MTRDFVSYVLKATATAAAAAAVKLIDGNPGQARGLFRLAATIGASAATARQDALRIKSLLSYGHELEHIPFRRMPI